MVKVVFKNHDEFYAVEFQKISNHVVSLTGIAPVNTTGFDTFNMNGVHLGEFGGFTTVFRQYENTVQYSDDGSVWVDPPEPDPDPDPSITLEERVNDLEVAVCELSGEML